MAAKNDGNDMPITETKNANLSKILSLYNAENMPMVIPTANANVIATMASRAVLGKLL